ncbi:MAG TPA: hypothetical protein GX515_09225 [Firmicutes bacterium]|nr:hypothetical protein [Bacillota bacterium]
MVATVTTTLDPTARLVEEKAAEKGKRVSIKRTLCSSAFEALLAGNPEEHDRLLSVYVENLAKEADVIVLAQVSMAKLAPRLAGRVAVPVLTSPNLAVDAVKRIIDTMP